MKILSVAGTRPQFVKMSVLVRAFDAYNATHHKQVTHRLLNTGQHYDRLMSEIFFRELEIPEAETLLGIHGGTPGVQTAAMLASVEASLLRWRPDAVVVYGDTNSTLAAALAAVKLHIPLIHLEAGLRSFNRGMQEEINRIVSDHVCDILLAPTKRAVMQLDKEGLGERTSFVGDVMLDAVIHYGTNLGESNITQDLGLYAGEYGLVTLHRAENTDDLARLTGVMGALERINIPIILPVHPRLERILGEQWLQMLGTCRHLHLIEPVGYLDMLRLQKHARLVLTDSGGVQKEAFFLGIPCLTMRNETEWLETLHGGWNKLVGTDCDEILRAVTGVLRFEESAKRPPRCLSQFGSGRAGACSVEKIIDSVRYA